MNAWIRAAALVWMGCGAAAYADVAIDKFLEGSPDGSVTVECIKGSVTIEGWDKNEVHVTGVQPNGVERIDYLSDNGDVTIKVIYPKRSRSAGEAVINVKAPMGNEANVGVVSAKVTITNMLGGATIKGVSGKVEVKGVEGPVIANTVSGGITIDSPASEVRAGTVSGSISIANTMGDIYTETVSGSTRIESNHLQDIDCESVSSSIQIKGKFETPGEVELESHSGSLTVFGGPIAKLRAESMSSSVKAEIEPTPDADIEMSSFSGGVGLYLPADIQAEFELESFSGSINITGITAAEMNKSARRIEFETGNDPDLKIEATSFSGSVSVEGK
ncbi:MAG: hypothetical protein AMXMBFR84_25460 [Candidatus Hydrogenedentota bacterium]